MEKKKAKVNVRELVDKYQENSDRIMEIADLCEKEQRERTDAENREYEALMRDNQLLRMKMQAATQGLPGVPAAAPEDNSDAVLRETLLVRGSKVLINAQRDTVTPQTTAALDGTGIIAVSEQGVLDPVRKGLIYDKVGLRIHSGLAGTLRWATHGEAVASFADEAERLVDSKVDWGKLEMKGHRMGIAIPVTREELEDSSGIVDRVVKSEMPAAIVKLINGALFCTTDKYTAADGNQKTRKVVGPLVEAYKKATAFAGELPTRKELLKMVGAVADKVDLVAPCWVMTAAMEVMLRDVKVDAGSGRFLCENGMILGYPVFTTSEIGEGNIAFGDWSYQAAGFFGDTSFIVDPYTLARRNSVDFVLNSRFGTVTLRNDVFVVGKAKTAGIGG